MTFAKILGPLDGSRVAEAALPKAEELVRGRPEATLLLLRAVEAKVVPVLMMRLAPHELPASDVA